jgi:hypothetical protein
MRLGIPFISRFFAATRPDTNIKAPAALSNVVSDFGLSVETEVPCIDSAVEDAEIIDSIGESDGEGRDWDGRASSPEEVNSTLSNEDTLEAIYPLPEGQDAESMDYMEASDWNEIINTFRVGNNNLGMYSPPEGHDVEIVDSMGESDWEGTANSPEEANSTRSNEDTLEEMYLRTRSVFLFDSMHNSDNLPVAASGRLQIWSDVEDDGGPQPPPAPTPSYGNSLGLWKEVLSDPRSSIWRG